MMQPQSPLSDLSPSLLAELLLGTVANSGDLAVLETALGDRTLIARALDAYPASAVMTMRDVADSHSSIWLAERLGARYTPPRERFRRADGSRVTTRGFALHSFDDRPAVIGGDRAPVVGVQFNNYDRSTVDHVSALWYANGNLHRGEDLPAAIRLNAIPSFHALQNAKRDFFFLDIGQGSREHCVIFEWREHGRQHRAHDRPALIATSLDGKRVFAFWMRNGLLHRGRDRPAMIECVREGDAAAAAPGKKLRVVGRSWFRRGKKHRSHGRPSVDRPGRHRMWHQNGVPYRAGGLPTTINFAGTNAGLFWENKRGALHRDGDLPAVVAINKGECWWMRGGKPHRMGGMPALVGESDGGHFCEWYVLGLRQPAADDCVDIALEQARAFMRDARETVAAESAAAAAASV